MKCIKCNEEILENESICNVCGADQKVESDDAVQENGNEAAISGVTEEEVSSQEVAVDTVGKATPDAIEKSIAVLNVAVSELISKIKSMLDLPHAKKFASGIVGVLVVIVLFMGLGGAAKGDDQWYDNKEMPLFFTDKDELHYYYFGDEDSTEILEGFGNTAFVYPVTETELYYVEEGELYYLKKGKEAVEIDDEVLDVFTDRRVEDLFYLRDDNELYYYNGAEGESILKGVKYIDEIIFQVEAGKTIINYQDDKGINLLVVIAKGEVVEIADRSEFSVLYTDAKKIIYSERDGNEQDIFIADYKGDSEKAFSCSSKVTFNNDGTKALFIDDLDLYYYDGKEDVKIDKDIDNFYVRRGEDGESFNAVVINDKSDVLVWFEGDEELIEVLDDGDFRSYTSTDDLKRFVVSNEDRELTVYSKKGDEYVDETYDIDDIQSIRMMDDNKTTLILDDRNTLYLYAIGSKEAEEILDDVANIFGYDQSSLFLQSDKDEHYHFDGKKAEEITDDPLRRRSMNRDVPSFAYVDDRGDFFYWKRGKDSQEYLGDVTSMVSYGNEYHYLMDDKGDIYIYIAGEKEVRETGIEGDKLYSFWNVGY